jgi:hypothetical protein
LKSLREQPARHFLVWPQLQIKMKGTKMKITNATKRENKMSRFILNAKEP